METVSHSISHLQLHSESESDVFPVGWDGQFQCQVYNLRLSKQQCLHWGGVDARTLHIHVYFS